MASLQGARDLDELVPTHDETSDIDLLHDIGSRMAAADPLHEVLERVIDMVTVASFCATWKSIVHGRSANVSDASALSSLAGSFQSQLSGRMRSSGAL